MSAHRPPPADAPPPYGADAFDVQSPAHEHDAAAEVEVPGALPPPERAPGAAAVGHGGASDDGAPRALEAQPADAEVSGATRGGAVPVPSAGSDADALEAARPPPADADAGEYITEAAAPLEGSAARSAVGLGVIELEAPSETRKWRSTCELLARGFPVSAASLVVGLALVVSGKVLAELNRPAQSRTLWEAGLCCGTPGAECARWVTRYDGAGLLCPAGRAAPRAQSWEIGSEAAGLLHVRRYNLALYVSTGSTVELSWSLADARNVTLVEQAQARVTPPDGARRALIELPGADGDGGGDAASTAGGSVAGAAGMWRALLKAGGSGGGGRTSRTSGRSISSPSPAASTRTYRLSAAPTRYGSRQVGALAAGGVLGNAVRRRSSRTGPVNARGDDTGGQATKANETLDRCGARLVARTPSRRRSSYAPRAHAPPPHTHTRRAAPRRAPLATRSAEVAQPTFLSPPQMSAPRWPLKLTVHSLVVQPPAARPSGDAPYLFLGFVTQVSNAMLFWFDVSTALWAAGVGLVGATVLLNAARFVRARPGRARTHAHGLFVLVSLGTGAFFAGCVATASPLTAVVRARARPRRAVRERRARSCANWTRARRVVRDRPIAGMSCRSLTPTPRVCAADHPCICRRPAFRAAARARHRVPRTGRGHGVRRVLPEGPVGGERSPGRLRREGVRRPRGLPRVGGDRPHAHVRIWRAAGGRVAAVLHRGRGGRGAHVLRLGLRVARIGCEGRARDALSSPSAIVVISIRTVY